MNTNYITEEAYKMYFAGLDDNRDSAPKETEKPELTKTDTVVYGDALSERKHLKEISKDGTSYHSPYYADGNIYDIEGLAEILKGLCNAAWGSDWGELTMDVVTGENSSNIKLPRITVDVNQRDISEGMSSIKPILIDVQKEYDEEGNETGEAYLIYRQFFDQNVEFNIYGQNSKQARDIMKKFEKLLLAYTGYIKRKGISEIFFLKEVSPRSSLNYYENIPMRTIYYFVRTETIIPVPISIINKINASIGAYTIDINKLKKLVENEPTNKEIEFDFFDGDNGIAFKP